MANLQDKGGRKRGKQVYLGGWDTEHRAALAFDLAALKYWGPTTELNVSQLVALREMLVSLSSLQVVWQRHNH